MEKLFKIKYSSVKCAFSLAEVILTLAIVGVLATMSLPNLLNSTSNLENVSALKKFYVTISSASKQMANDNGGNLLNIFSGGGMTATNGIPYKKYLNVIPSTNCQSANNSLAGNCWHGSGEWMNYSKVIFDDVKTPPNFYTYSGGLVLLDGTLILFSNVADPACGTTGGGPWLGWHNGQQETYSTTGGYYVCIPILVDINGFRGPNRVGLDIFAFHILKDGNVVPGALNGAKLRSDGFDCTTTALQGNPCAP